MRITLLAAGVIGAAGVLLGAYSAHGLEGRLSELGHSGESLAKRLDNFETGVRYQMHSALALAALAALRGRVVCGRGASVAAGFLLGGTAVFSGLLYALAFVGPELRWLGAIVPIGGVMLVCGWAVIGMEALRAPPKTATPAADESSLRAELVRLEEAITHQQKMLQDLNEAVTATRDGADESARRTVAMEATVKRLVDLQQAADDLPDERPPHY